MRLRDSDVLRGRVGLGQYVLRIELLCPMDSSQWLRLPRAARDPAEWDSALGGRGGVGAWGRFRFSLQGEFQIDGCFPAATARDAPVEC